MTSKETNDNGKKLREVQKKLSIITEAYEKEKIKSKNTLKILKDYEDLTREKEYQINDLQKSIEDLNSKITLALNEQNYKFYSSKVSVFLGNIFQKNIEKNQLIEDLINELNYVKNGYESLSDKLMKQKELNLENENQFMSIINGQKNSLKKLNEKFSTIEKQNKDIKDSNKNLNKRIESIKEKKNQKKKEMNSTTFMDEIEKKVKNINDEISNVELKIQKKNKEYNNLVVNINEVEEQIKVSDDDIFNLSEKFPCDKEVNGIKTRYDVYFERDSQNPKKFSLNLLNEKGEKISYDVKKLTSCGRNITNKRKFMCIYLDNQNEIEFNLIFNESIADYFEQKYFYVINVINSNE